LTWSSTFMKAYSILKLSNSPIQLWWRFANFAFYLNLLISFSKDSNSFWITLRFCFTSSKSYCSNWIFLVWLLQLQLLLLHLFNKHIILALQLLYLNPFVDVDNFLVKLKECSMTFWLVCSYLRISLNITHSKSMEPNILLISINCLWRSSNSFWWLEFLVSNSWTLLSCLPNIAAWPIDVG